VSVLRDPRTVKRRPGWSAASLASRRVAERPRRYLAGHPPRPIATIPTRDGTTPVPTRHHPTTEAHRGRGDREAAGWLAPRLRHPVRVAHPVPQGPARGRRRRPPGRAAAGARRAGDDDITLYINSPGGIITGMFAIYDTMRLLKSKVNVRCIGLAASAGAFLLATGTGTRSATENARIMIHQPLGGARGTAKDIEIQAKNIVWIRERINEILAERTGPDLETIRKDTDRDYWMTAAEALEYGLIDEVVEAGPRQLMLRLSTLFVRTLREDPADAELPGHTALVRAGYIRRAGSGHAHLAAAGQPRLPQRRAHRPRGDGPAWAPRRCTSRRCCRASPTRLRSLGGVRRHAVPAAGPARQRPPARADARGDVHAAGQGPVLVLQGPAAEPLPDPDQVPRRGAAARRPAAGPRVRDEGLVLLRRRRRRPGRVLRAPPRGLHRHLRPARPRLRDRVGDVGGDGRLAQRGVPVPHAGRRGHLRALARRLRRQRRGRHDPAPDPMPGSTTPRPAHVEDTPTPHDRHPGRLRQRAPPARTGPGRRRHAQERARHAPHPDGTREPAGDRCARATARWTQAAAGAGRAGRGRAVHRRGLRRAPGAGQGLHRPRRARAARRAGSATSSTRGRRGHPLDHRRERARPPRLRPGVRPRLHPRRHDRGRRDPRRRPGPDGSGPLELARGHRDRPHLPARSQVRRGARAAGARRARQARHR
jgi:ATP-dependent Clp protease, protease subunit